MIEMSYDEIDMAEQTRMAIMWDENHDTDMDNSGVNVCSEISFRIEHFPLAPAEWCEILLQL